MKKIWGTLTQVGITQGIDSIETRRISYVNYIALLAILYVIVRILLSLEDLFYCTMLFVSGLPAFFILLLNKYRYYKTARICLITFYSSAITFFTYFFIGGLKGGAHVVLFTLVPLPFMLFDLKQRRYILSCLGFVLFCFTLIIVLQYIHPLPVNAKLNIDVVTISTIILTIAILLLITWYFCSSNAKAEEMLLVEKEKLEVVNSDLQNALNEVNVLSGLVPICAKCKKIRDDKGYWNNLEAYIEKHSDASFSHGICSECMDKLYGEESWYIEMKKKNGSK